MDGQIKEITTIPNQKRNRAKKILIICVRVFLIAALLFLFIVWIRNRVMLKNEKEYLDGFGLVNPVALDDGRSINVTQRGSESPEHTIVVLAGLGMSDTSVIMEKMLSGFYSDNKVVYIDRAGYGFSDDSDNTQTNENIVSDYRGALKNAGISSPYILLAHSIGGAYATYWETMYPDEIEAVIFVDGSQLSADAFSDEEKSSRFADMIDSVGCKLGLGRLLLRNYYYLLPSNYSEEEQKLGDALSVRQMASKALQSEANLLYENASGAFNGIITNDIPKLYICSSWGIHTEDECIEYMTWIREQQVLNHLKTASTTPDQSLIADILDEYETLRREKLLPYINKLGNCEFVLLSGDHMIYEQKPEECAAIIAEFLKAQ